MARDVKIDCENFDGAFLLFETSLSLDSSTNSLLIHLVSIPLSALSLICRLRVHLLHTYRSTHSVYRAFLPSRIPTISHYPLSISYHFSS